jgi:Resolvase, N terminal domain
MSSNRFRTRKGTRTKTAVAMIVAAAAAIIVPASAFAARVRVGAHHPSGSLLIMGSLVAGVSTVFVFMLSRERRRHAAGIAGNGDALTAAVAAPLAMPVPDSLPRPASHFGHGALVIGYLTAQATTSRSPEHDIVRACERSGWELTEIVCDHSNGSILERPGIARALERIAAGEAEGLVVRDARLLSRSKDFAAFVRWFRDAGATLIALDLGMDTSTPEGRRLASALITLNGWAGDWLATKSARRPVGVHRESAP